MNKLTREQVLRYSRHIILPEVGMEGQQKLLAASVLCVGTGGLGSPTLLYLAAAGVGRLGIVDFDAVDRTNLQRQVLHDDAGVGTPKAESAKRRLLALNPGVKIEPHNVKLTRGNAMKIIGKYDIVTDGTDNFAARYLLNDACVLSGKPYVYGSVFKFDGQCSVFHAKKGPCYRCLFPEPPPAAEAPSCTRAGILGVVPGVIGLLQAAETIKLIVGMGDSLVGRLVLFNALEMSFREIKIREEPACPVCGKNPTIKKLIDYEKFCGA